MASGRVAEAEAAGLRWPLVVIGYFAFQAAYRRLLGGSLGLDEAEVILDARTLAWGYGPQPPLYVWLQWAAFRLIPDPLLAMALLKNTLLAGSFLAVHALVRSAHPPRIAGLAAGSMMLLPQIAWESQRALTHSVLATTLAVVATLVFWTRVLERRPGADAGFGAVLGLGLIAKANFAAVPAALWLAAASVPRLRARLRPAGIAASLAVAAAIAAGPLAWMLRHPDLAFASSYKLRRVADAAWPVTAVQGLGALAVAVAGFLALLAVVTAVLRWRFARPGRPPQPPALDGFLLRLVVVGVALAALALLASGATTAKERWLQPALFLAAPAATLWLLPRVTDAGARWLGRLIVLSAVLVALALPVPLLTGTPGKPARGGAPVAPLADAIARRFPDAGRVLAYPPWLAGNLLYRQPSWDVVRAGGAATTPGETVLLVWMDDPADGAALAAAIGARTGHVLRLGEPARFARAYPWHPSQELVLYAAALTSP